MFSFVGADIIRPTVGASYTSPPKQIMKIEKIILASASPRRREILKKNGIDFEVIVPSGDEKNIVGEKYSEELVNECAIAKAKSVGASYTSPIIVSCDTVVVNDGIIIGKPKDREDAIKILKSLSNKTHIVASSVCVMRGDEIKVAHEITKVTFRELSEKEIEDYIDRCNPLDKAGSYGIQDEGFDFAVKVEGNIDNVIGFPMKAFNSII